jgi:hypothetical protein
MDNAAKQVTGTQVSASFRGRFAGTCPSGSRRARCAARSHVRRAGEPLREGVHRAGDRHRRADPGASRRPGACRVDPAPRRRLPLLRSPPSSCRTATLRQARMSETSAVRPRSSLAPVPNGRLPVGLRPRYGSTAEKGRVRRCAAKRSVIGKDTGLSFSAWSARHRMARAGYTETWQSRPAGTHAALESPTLGEPK